MRTRAASFSRSSSDLERHPRAVLAFGGVDVVDEDDRTLWSDAGRPPRVVAGAPWTLSRGAEDDDVPQRVAAPISWRVPARARGRRGLFIRPTSGNVEPDLYWVFALGLLGDFRFVPDCRYLKRLHGANASVGWGARRASHVLDGITVPYGLSARLRAAAARSAACPATAALLGIPARGRMVHAELAVAVGGAARSRQACRRARAVRRPASGLGGLTATRVGGPLGPPLRPWRT